MWRPLKTVISCDLFIIIRECSSTLYVGLAHAVPPTNTKFKPLLLPTQAGMPYTNTHKHRTSYCKSTLTFLGPECWKSICAARQKPVSLAFLHHNWASEASPTQGCSIEISRDIYVYMCMCLSWSKKRRRNYVGQTRACSKSVLGGKIRPVTPVLFILTIR